MKNKITLIILSLLAILCLGVSCKKDKTPEPEKKLVKWTQQSYNGEDLKSSREVEFSYDGKGRLSQVIYGDNSSIYTYSSSSITITYSSSTTDDTYSLENGKITKLATGSRNYKYVYDAENHVTKLIEEYEYVGSIFENEKAELFWKDGNIDGYRYYYDRDATPPIFDEYKFEYGEAVRGIDVNMFTFDLFMNFGVDPFFANAGYFGKTKNTRLVTSMTEVLPEDSEDEPWSLEFTYTFDADKYVTSVEWVDGSWRTKLLFEWE